MAKRVSRGSKQSGIYMVMLAGMLLALITLVALFFASGFLAANKTRLQNSTNFASLAAIERYVRSLPAPGDPPLTYNQHADAARNQANALLDRQALLGATQSGTGSVGGLGYVGQNGAGGDISFGVWYPTRNAVPPNPCGSGPCFAPAVPQPGGANPPIMPSVNAVKLNVKTPHPFNVPLLSVLGFDSLDIESESIAAVVPRCTVLVLDASQSSQEGTHYVDPLIPVASQPSVTTTRPSTYTPPSNPTFNCSGTDYYLYAKPYKYTCPRNLMPFAFNQDQLPTQVSGQFVDPQLLSPPPCGFNAQIYQTLQGIMWCNLEYFDGLRRRFGVATPYPFPLPADDHLQQLPDYYRVMDSPYGKMIVDTLIRPQPLSDFLLGFNAGARMMIEQASQLDRAGIISFHSEVDYKFPASGLSTDLGFVAQITNADRINPGWTSPPSLTNPPNPPLHPNFVDLGLFATVQGTGGSNIIAGLDRAISMLSDPNSCPANAQKSIILATDGIMNCHYDTLTSSWGCNNLYGHYLDSENYLLNRGFDTGLAQDSILRRLQRSSIAFSVFISGRSGPNIVNRFITNPAEAGGGHFVNFDEARALGMTSMPPFQDPAAVNSTVFVDSRSDDIPDGPGSVFDECTNDPGIGPEINGLATLEERQSACAFYKLGRDNVYFRRPLAAFYKLAVDTGGWYCPFLAKAPAGSYTSSAPDAKLTLAYRQSLGTNTRIGVNPFNRNAGQEAAVCARQTLGLNPFVLVRED